MTIAELIVTKGYRYEEHKIETEDGYVLTAWRIRGLKSEPIDECRFKKPVILQHGLLDNSATWLFMDKNNSLPFLLADEKYDVWMTNSRGNINSFEHMDPEHYNVRDSGSKYWDFSWDEMAKYDVKANLDYVLTMTN